MTTIPNDEFIRRIDQIPTLPIVSQKIIALLEDENVSYKELAEIIERDQALAVRILKMANSTFYGSISQISSIDFALVKLGLGEVKNILHAFSIYNFFADDNLKGFDRNQFWKHSIICSQIAKYLGQYFNIEKDDSLFLSGLIHDLGKLIFDYYFHDAFLEVIDYIKAKNETFSASEKVIIGFTHYQVAAKLLQKWNFPKKVILQVFYHHSPWSDNSYSTSSIIIYLANILTKLTGYQCTSGEKEFDIKAFANSKAMEFIVKSGFDLNMEKLEVLTSNIKEFICDEKDNMLKFF